MPRVVPDEQSVESKLFKPAARNAKNPRRKVDVDHIIEMCGYLLEQEVRRIDNGTHVKEGMSDENVNRVLMILKTVVDVAPDIAASQSKLDGKANRLTDSELHDELVTQLKLVRKRLGYPEIAPESLKAG